MELLYADLMSRKKWQYGTVLSEVNICNYDTFQDVEIAIADDSGHPSCSKFERKIREHETKPYTLETITAPLYGLDNINNTLIVLGTHSIQVVAGKELRYGIIEENGTKWAAYNFHGKYWVVLRPIDV